MNRLQKVIQFEMEKTNGPLEENFLKSLEDYWEFGLPKDYRFFLLKHNGGIPKKKRFNFYDQSDGSCVSNFFGVQKSFDNLLKKAKYMDERVPGDTLPIGRDVYGNLICIVVKGKARGKIYFWDHEMEADPDQGEVPDYSNLTLIADSFSEFMENLQDEIDFEE